MTTQYNGSSYQQPLNQTKTNLAMKYLFSTLFAVSMLYINLAHAEQTLSLIKPDAVAANHVGAIIDRFEQKGLRIAAIKKTRLTQEQAGQFYAVHKDRPFYGNLTEFMSSGPIVAIVLDGEGAIAKNRQIMGATDPKEAAPGTIRADFAQSKTKNAVHGSDSPESAKEEIAFFFKPNEIY